MSKQLYTITKRLIQNGVVVAGLFLIAACDMPGSSVPDTARFSPTKEEKADLIALGHAGAISKGCRGNVFLNEGAAHVTLLPIFKRAKAAGVRAEYETATLMGLSQTDAQILGAQYRASRGIVVNVDETWCSAGRYEVANNTRIGKYLVDGGRSKK